MNAVSEISLLGGRVMVRSLPTVEGPPPPGAPRLKRLLLAQGELAHFYDGPEAIQYLAFTEFKVGAVRGNHYHQQKAEGIYVIEGEVRLVVEDIQTKQRESAHLKPGTAAWIPVGIAHALQPLTVGKAVEYSPARFEAADVHRYQLV
jgi:quercetin dioxygenase-like cupin family protein